MGKGGGAQIMVYEKETAFSLVLGFSGVWSVGRSYSYSCIPAAKRILIYDISLHLDEDSESDLKKDFNWGSTSCGVSFPASDGTILDGTKSLVQAGDVKLSRGKSRSLRIILVPPLHKLTARSPSGECGLLMSIPKSLERGSERDRS